MKKLTSLLLIGALAGALSGCGGSGSGTVEAVSTPAAVSVVTAKQ